MCIQANQLANHASRLSKMGNAKIVAHAGAMRLFLTNYIKGLKMTNQQIIEFYDRNLNMTLRELSKITGKTIQQLKTILMGVL